MTLIAFATYGDRAELITDTAAYSPLCRRFGHRNKIHALPHIDAVMATQGMHAFGVDAKIAFGELDYSFDNTIDQAPDWLRHSWNLVEGERQRSEAAAFLLGYSEAAGEFVAYRFLAENDFQREQITGAHIMPTPLSYRITSFEAERLRQANQGTDLDQLFEEWSSVDALRPPASREEWKEVALEARRTRALHPYPTFRVIVAGKLMWTRVARGRVRTELLHEFNDSGDELDQLVAGTLHPRAQIAPCGCGSGARALDCHIAASADQECPCGSENAFRACCMITPEEAEAAPTMGLVASA